MDTGSPGALAAKTGQSKTRAMYKPPPIALKRNGLKAGAATKKKAKSKIKGRAPSAAFLNARSNSNEILVDPVKNKKKDRDVQMSMTGLFG